MPLGDCDPADPAGSRRWMLMRLAPLAHSLKRDDLGSLPTAARVGLDPAEPVAVLSANAHRRQTKALDSPGRAAQLAAVFDASRAGTLRVAVVLIPAAIRWGPAAAGHARGRCPLRWAPGSPANRGVRTDAVLEIAALRG